MIVRVGRVLERTAVNGDRYVLDCVTLDACRLQWALLSLPSPIKFSACMKRDIKLLAGNADRNSLRIVLLILLLKEAKTSNPKPNLKNTTQTRWTASYKQAPVSQKSRDFSGLSRVPQFPLHLRNAEVLSHQTSQSSRFSLHLSCNPYINQVNRGAFQTKQINVWQLAFRARKVLGTLEKQAPGDLRLDLRGHFVMYINEICI